MSDPVRHRQPEIGLSQRGSIVHTVPDHGHPAVPRLDCGNDLGFLRRKRARKHISNPNLVGDGLHGLLGIPADQQGFNTVISQ